MAKPFSIQAPEDIAKEYMGNKQRIAQAAQMGVVDPTAAVLAGMFIDRMRSAQVMEAGQTPTVAQQVLGGGGSPMPSPQGLGSVPSPVPPPPPQMSPMAPPQGMPPQGMAMGGLVGLPVPDAMFDEPTNGGFDDGYAGGGLVAFSDGGDIDTERLRAALRAQESGGDYGVMNAEGSGAMGAYQFMPDTARALAKRLGMEYRPDLMSGKGGRSKEGRAYQERLMDAQMKDILAFAGGDIGRAGIYHFAGPNEKGWGPKTRQYEKDILRRYSGSKDTGELPERDIETAAGRFDAPMDVYEALQRRFGPSEEEQEVDAARMARAKEMASDEYYEETRKADMWQTLAEIGFNMASSKSPYLLQAVGEAAAAAMPGARADKKERKALQDRALDIMGSMNNLKRKENLQLLGIATDMADKSTQQAQTERRIALDERQVELAEDKLKAELAALEAKGEDVNDRVTRYLLDFPEGSPEHEAAKRVYEARRPVTAAPVDAKTKLAELKGKGAVTEGATAQDSDGKTIVFSGGQWVYP